MNGNRVRLACLFLLMLVLLTGCRRRLTSPDMDNHAGAGEQAETAAGHTDNGNNIEKPRSRQEKQDEGEGTQTDEPTENGLTRENPESSQKEYDESADAEIRAGQAQRLQAAGDGEGFFAYAGDALGAVIRVNDEAERTATQTNWVEQSERQSATESGELAESALQYYTVLLRERTGSLYECKKLYAYLETPEEYVTIHKSSDMHAFLISAGLYDVSARLRENDLIVDAGWVVRKNPDVIIKLVDSSCLGRNVQTAAGTGQVLTALGMRPEWDHTAALQKGRLFLISEEIFTNPYLRCAGELFLAKSVYPELFQDVILNEALTMLIDEAGGSAFPGTYFYDAEGGISI